MKKITMEIVAERMKARTFIKNYYKENGEMPTVEQVAAARALSEGEAADLLHMFNVSTLVAQSEGKEVDVIPSAPVPEIGINKATPIMGSLEAVVDATGEGPDVMN